MPKRSSKRPRDANPLAQFIADIATGAVAMRRVEIDDENLELAERALRERPHRYRQDAKQTQNG